MNARNAPPSAADAPRIRQQLLKLESLGLLVRRIRDGIVSQVERDLAADGIELTHMQFRTISWLGKHGVCTATELARGLEYDPGALTRVVDRLVERGLVQREAQAEDRRSLRLSLTEPGDALWVQAYGHFERVNARAVRGLSAVERKQLMQLLARVADALELNS